MGWPNNMGIMTDHVISSRYTWRMTCFRSTCVDIGNWNLWGNKNKTCRLACCYPALEFEPWRREGAARLRQRSWSVPTLERSTRGINTVSLTATFVRRRMLIKITVVAPYHSCRLSLGLHFSLIASVEVSSWTSRGKP